MFFLFKFINSWYVSLDTLSYHNNLYFVRNILNLSQLISFIYVLINSFKKFYVIPFFLILSFKLKATQYVTNTNKTTVNQNSSSSFVFYNSSTSSMNPGTIGNFNLVFCSIEENIFFKFNDRFKKMSYLIDLNLLFFKCNNYF